MIEQFATEHPVLTVLIIGVPLLFLALILGGVVREMLRKEEP
jgi:hypothetical protein